MTALINLRSDNQLPSDKRRILEFGNEEFLVELGVVYRLEFRGSRCNLTLKNTTDKRQSVNVRIHVLNRSLMEIWHQSEKWALSSLQPDQVHVASWDFVPAVPDVVWNEESRSIAPSWIILDVV